MTITPYRETKAERVKRIRALLNHLTLKPLRFARKPHVCQFCNVPIEKGDEFRDGGMCKRAHEFCFQAVATSLPEDKETTLALYAALVGIVLRAERHCEYNPNEYPWDETESARDALNKANPNWRKHPWPERRKYV